MLSLAMLVVLFISSETLVVGETLMPGQKFPQHLFASLDSSSFYLLPHGRKTVMLFFTVECPHCRKEISNLLELYTQFNESVEFLGISLSDPRKTEDLIANRKFPFLILHCDRKFARETYKISNVPTIYLVDERDTVRYSRIGEAPLATDRLILQEFLAAK